MSLGVCFSSGKSSSSSRVISEQLENAEGVKPGVSALRGFSRTVLSGVLKVTSSASSYDVQENQLRISKMERDKVERNRRKWIIFCEIRNRKNEIGWNVMT